MKKLFSRLQTDHPQLNFVPGSRFTWTPERQEVVFLVESLNAGDQVGEWALLHEVSHALLGHTTYQSDIELLQMEVAAWDKARQLADAYEITIDNDHIEDCLDTYRDWLHQRSRCPVCTVHCLQNSPQSYLCHNCGAQWQVTTARFCRPYRRLVKS